MDIHPIPPKLWGSLEDRKPSNKTPKIPSEPGKSWDVTLVPSSFLTQYSLRISGTENYTTTTPRQKSEFLKLELSRKGSSQGSEWSWSFLPGGYLGRCRGREVPFRTSRFIWYNFFIGERRPVDFPFYEKRVFSSVRYGETIRNLLFCDDFKW